MIHFKNIIPIVLFLIVVATACSDDDENTKSTVEPPTAATLIFPENNTVCNEGTIVSETETDVLFQWEEATNASSYVLQIINLDNGSARNISTLSNEFLIRILRGTPYSWSVKSLVGGTNETAESPVWRFYNAGLPVESHPPFPAEAISPQGGTTVEQGTIALQWEASDIDNDISSYSVVLDTMNPPVTEAGSTSNTSLEVSVSSGLVYYWKIITIDALGNASHSSIFQFAVN
jgi:hypothetical protein